LNRRKTNKRRNEVKKTWWLVESHYYDDGTVTCRCEGTVMADKRPGNEKISTSEVDIYRDWCDSRATADRLVEAARDFEPVPLRRPA
jgi:hypothetical protein